MQRPSSHQHPDQGPDQDPDQVQDEDLDHSNSNSNSNASTGRASTSASASASTGRPTPRHRHIRKSTSASGVSLQLGVRFRDIWIDADADGDGLAQRRRAAWDAASEKQSIEQVLPPLPCQRQSTKEPDLLMALELSRRAFQQEQEQEQQRRPKGVLRTKDRRKGNVRQRISFPEDEDEGEETGNTSSLAPPRLAVARSASMPTLLKKETNSAHTRKRWDDPSHPQTRNNILPLQMPKRQASTAVGSNHLRTNTSTSTNTNTSTSTNTQQPQQNHNHIHTHKMSPPAPIERNDSLSEASTVDDDHSDSNSNSDSEETSITESINGVGPTTGAGNSLSASIPTPPPMSTTTPSLLSLLDDDDEHDEQYALQTKIVQEKMGNRRLRNGNDTSIGTTTGTGISAHNGLVFQTITSTSTFISTKSANTQQTGYNRENSKDSNKAAVRLPVPPRRVASPVPSSPASHKLTSPSPSPSMSAFTRTDSSGDITTKTDDTCALSQSSDHDDSQLSSPHPSTETKKIELETEMGYGSSLDKTSLMLVRKCVDMVRQRRSESRTYTDPLVLPSSKSDKMLEPCYYYYYSKGSHIISVEPAEAEHDEIDRQLALAMFPESVGRYFNALVLSTKQVPLEDFWRRYFWRCSEKRMLKEMLLASR